MNKNKKQAILYPEYENGIYLYEYVEINGIKQYIQVRGQNKNNPLLLVLHGGPGGSIAGLSHVLMGKWEEQFTVVNFDQRNACKTYLANKENAFTIAKQGSLEDYMKDVEEIVAYLHTIYEFDKLYLLGFSWGSVIGAEFAKRHPEYIERYIAVGQLVNFKDGYNFICDKMSAQAEEKQDKKLITKAQALKDAYPDKLEMNKQFMKTIQGFAMLASKEYVKHGKAFPIGALIGSPFLNFKEKKSMMISDYRLLEGTYQTMLGYDFRDNMKFEVPVTFVYGDEDISCPDELLKNCYDAIEAPEKECVIIEEASHMCFFDQPEKFIEILLNIK